MWHAPFFNCVTLAFADSSIIGASGGVTGFYNANLVSPDPLSTVASLCDGHSACLVKGSSDFFMGDPAPGVSKYATFSYTCGELTLSTWQGMKVTANRL